MKNIRNNLFILREMYKASPRRILWEGLDGVIEQVLYAVYNLFFMRFIIECIQREVSFNYVAICILIYSFLCILGAGVNKYLVDAVVPETNVEIQSYLMKKIYDQALKVDVACYEDASFYDNYTKSMEEVLSRGERIIDVLKWGTGCVISIIIYLVVVLIYEPVIIPLLIIAVLLINYFNSKYVGAKYERWDKTAKQRRRMDYVRRIIYQQEFAKDIRLSHIFNPIKVNFHHTAKEMRGITKKYGKKASKYRFGNTLVSSLGVYLVVQGFILYKYLIHHSYTLGALTTVLNAASSLNDQLGALGWVMADFNENGVFIENYRAFFRYEPSIKEDEKGKVPSLENNHIELRNVSFSYTKDGEDILQDINIHIPAGKTVAIVGHNGAGKSTLIKLLMRLYDVTEGEILLDGTNIKDYRLSCYRNKFGTIFQDFKIFALSVGENVLLGPLQKNQDQQKVKKALKDSGIYSKISNTRKGIKSIMTKEFDEEGLIMSGGEQQKLAVARVFARESSIAILDEPSSALDPLSEYEIFQNMMKACEGKTIIFISHRLSTTALADNIYMLENGKVIESGNHSELMALKGKYHEMYTMQAKRYKEVTQGEADYCCS